MKKPIKQSITIKATPAQVYETLMDSKLHSELTGSPAEMSNEVGGTFTAYDGYIQGKNLELVPNKIIVQEWRGSGKNWKPDYFSKVRFELTEVPGGTRLDFTHEGVPDEEHDNIEQGWVDNYWDKLEKKFGKLNA